MRRLQGCGGNENLENQSYAFLCGCASSVLFLRVQLPFGRCRGCPTTAMAFYTHFSLSSTNLSFLVTSYMLVEILLCHHLCQGFLEQSKPVLPHALQQPR